MINTIQKYILIDSKYKSAGSTSNFKIFLPNQITIASYLQINCLYLPRLAYLINQHNNTFIISFGSVVTVITIPSSNYNPIELASYINSKVSINNFLITYNQATFQYTFTANTSFILDFSTSNFYKLLSLNKQIYNSVNNYFYTGIINFNFPKYININFANIPNDVMVGNSSSTNFNFIIPVMDSNYGDIISYNNVNYNIKMKVDNFKTNYLDLIITDDYNHEFENNNGELFMIIEYNSYN